MTSISEGLSENESAWRFERNTQEGFASNEACRRIKAQVTAA